MSPPAHETSPRERKRSQTMASTPHRQAANHVLFYHSWRTHGRVLHGTGTGDDRDSIGYPPHTITITPGVQADLPHSQCSTYSAERDDPGQSAKGQYSANAGVTYDSMVRLHPALQLKAGKTREPVMGMQMYIPCQPAPPCSLTRRRPPKPKTKQTIHRIVGTDARLV